MNVNSKIQIKDRFQKIEVSLLGVRINILPMEELVDFILKSIQEQKKTIVANVNTHAMNIAYRDEKFRTFLNDADLVFCDGFGVKWGAKLVGLDIPFRYTPPDWLPSLFKACEQYGYSFFFLGSRPGVSEKAAHNLKALFPDLQITGVHHGYFNKEQGQLENTDIIRKINDGRPNILLIGFGMPLQEMWLRENWAEINTDVAIPIGAAFDFISGEIWRGPTWMTNYGLEWLSRLFTEPRRLWRRYLVGNPLFLFRLIRWQISNDKKK